MGLAPVSHSLHVLRAAEVIAVGGLAQPTLLAGLLAGVAALGLGTVTLTILIAKIGEKEIVATAALAPPGPNIHRPRTHHQPRPQSKKNHRRRRKTKRGRRKKNCQLNSGKKIHSEENGISNRRIKSNFIPPLT
jgi:hypothetical protein